jgi:hypothetical protein
MNKETKKGLGIDLDTGEITHLDKQEESWGKKFDNLIKKETELLHTNGDSQMLEDNERDIEIIKSFISDLRSKDRDTLIEKINEKENNLRLMSKIEPKAIAQTEGYKLALDTVKQIILETLK